MPIWIRSVWICLTLQHVTMNKNAPPPMTLLRTGGWKWFLNTQLARFCCILQSPKANECVLIINCLNKPVLVAASPPSLGFWSPYVLQSIHFLSLCRESGAYSEGHGHKAGNSPWWGANPMQYTNHSYLKPKFTWACFWIMVGGGGDMGRTG